MDASRGLVTQTMCRAALIEGALATLLFLMGQGAGAAPDDQADHLPPVSERARQVHAAGMLFDGHNDLPWRLRAAGDIALTKFDLSQRLNSGQTDIPRLREGGVKAQFWSVFIPSNHSNPARTVVQQIDLVRRMVERYHNVFEMAYSAADVERITRKGKIASLIGIEGGVAIENDLAMLRAFYDLGARYMTLTHSKTIDWADACTDTPKHDGLTPFGERVVKEMNRLGMLVDISHVSPATMADALRVSRAPLIASHSSAFAICPSPRNVPDEILTQVKKNNGVVMVNFFSEFVVPKSATRVARVREELSAKYPDKTALDKAVNDWVKAQGPKLSRGTYLDVVDHIDHLVKVAGIDHVGIGSDFDGISSWPIGLDDVSSYPRLTDEMLHRGYSEADIHKILGANILRVLRQAGEVAKRLRATTTPEVGEFKPAKSGG